MSETDNKCDHGVYFNENDPDLNKMTVQQIRDKYPRLFGKCPKGCGYNGIAYASWAHYLYGDW